MADLMTDTYTYTDLANKYGNFQVPAFCVKVDNEEVFPDDGVSVSSISITLSIDCASCALIEIAGAYDVKNREFSSSIKSALSLGKIVEIEIGYLSSLITVFKGYIASVSMNVSEQPCLSVTVLDVRKLMMDARYKERYFDDAGYSDIVSGIMDDYSALCTLEQASSSDELDKKIYQSGSDYDFIAGVLTDKLNKEFFVVADKAYFRTPNDSAASLITLEYGESLLSFTRQSDYLDLNIVGVSYDVNELTIITSDAAAKNDDISSTVLNKPADEILLRYEAETTDELEMAVKHTVAKKKSKAKLGSGRCIGLPELVPGRYVKISKADSDMDKKYYITQVKHSISESGFITEFQTDGS